jgi:outer membrane protein assembly factor BamC
MKLSYMVVASLLVVSGCSLWPFDDKIETPVRMREKLEIPPDLSRSGADDLSSLPTATTATVRSATSATEVAPSQPQVGVPASTRARLEREGNQRWLVVNAAPDQVWTALRDYLKRSHGDLSVENAKHGYLETDWVEQRPNLGKSAVGRAVSRLQSTGLRDKFRVRVENGRAAGTTEVMVTHIGLEETVIGSGYGGPNTIWQPRKPDPVLEADLLDRMLAALGAVDPVTRPLLRAEPEQPAVKRAARPKGPLVLAGETSDSAWRRVSQALDRAGIVIEDRDRGSGILYVRSPSVSKDSGGVFGWLFGDRKKKSDTDDGQDRYQLRLKTDKNGMVVDVLDVKGDIDKSDAANRLLDLLYQQLF